MDIWVFFGWPQTCARTVMYYETTKGNICKGYVSR